MWVQLALTAITLAFVVLVTVWLAREKNKYRKLVWVTLFLTFDLVMFGGFTRLTDSGLGCPDWPGCYGNANPLQAKAQIDVAQTAMPTGPVTTSKAWTEMVHRYLAMMVGVLIIILMGVSWRRWVVAFARWFVTWMHRWQGRRDRTPASPPGLDLLPLVPTTLFGLVCLQGAFGAWTVTMKLQPVIVTTHLLLGLTLLGAIAWLASQHNEQVLLTKDARALRTPALLALLVLAIQIALGGWVSTNYATLACTEYPMCQGSWIPDMDFANGYTLWRHLGRTGSGEFLPFAALTAIHFVHRNFALVVIAFAGWVGYRASRIAGLASLGRWLLVVLCLQFLTGVSTIYLNWPLLLAVAHNGGAAMLVMLLVMINYRTRNPAATGSNLST